MPPKGMPSPGSGRKPINNQTAEINQQLYEAAVHAARKFRWSVKGVDDKGHKVKPLSGSMVRLCEIVIAHAIGLPRQKIDLKHAGILTLRDLAEIAYQDKPQPVVEGKDGDTTSSSDKPDSPG